MSKPKKQRKKSGNRPAAAQPAAPSKSIFNRRNAIKALIVLPVAGVAGAAIHRYDVQNRGLHDLTLIGQGNPVVVQIHDPACQLCRRLMNNSRKALKGQDDIVFRVADITTTDGKQFQMKHNVDTVSLVLFDATGKRVDTVQGVTPVDELKTRFSNINS